MNCGTLIIQSNSMNKQLWNLYKDSEQGKNCISVFQLKDDIGESIFKILAYSSKWGGNVIEESYLNDIDIRLELWLKNLCERGFIPKEWTRESYVKFIEEFDIFAPKLIKKKYLELDKDGKMILDENTYAIKKDQYRIKASCIEFLSLILFYDSEFFKPMLLPQRFETILKNCDALGLEMPEIPRSKDYRAYLLYYFDICTVWDDFQKEYDLTDAELCACIYDFALMLREKEESKDLPKPTNVWLTGAGAINKGDFEILDSLGAEGSGESVWACNERTRRGDIVVVYCNSPRSYIHSIWRSNSGGIFNPFDHYHCRTTICNGILVPPITFNELKNDEYMSQIPIVRKGLRGINGVELTSKDYSALLQMIKSKGGDVSKLPQLYEGGTIDFGELTLEKDVEEKILIPMLERLGYTSADWTRQLSQKAGRKEKAIPDFVFFPKGEKHFENAPMIIEAKFDMAPVQELLKAYKQGLSYARMLRSSIMGICDKERLILYKVDENGSADRSNPIFEDHWDAIYSDSEVGANLAHLIGREVIANK